MAEDAKSSAALAEVGLPAPVRALTRVPVDEWAMRRIWQGVQRRREARERPGVGIGTSRPRSWAVLASVLGLAVALLVAHSLVPRAAQNPAVSQLVVGPLLTKEARRFEGVEAAADGTPARVELADGSSIEALPGARVDGLASSPSEFVVLLRRGRARFAVKPGGPRRWSIETRDARVEVVGTVLSVEADGTGATVNVEVGAVLVRSPALTDGVQRLEAGQSLRLKAASADAAASPDTAEAAEATEATEAADATDAAEAPEASLESPAPARARPSSARERASAASRPRAATLWEQVDEARRDNRPARAAALLGRLLREHPDDSQAALAAFTRGVIQLDQLGQAEQASRSFEQALGLGLGAALREDGYARWARAALRSGDPDAARAVLAEYVRHYPRGRHRASIERLLGHGGEQPAPGVAQ